MHRSTKFDGRLSITSNESPQIVRLSTCCSESVTGSSNFRQRSA